MTGPIQSHANAAPHHAIVLWLPNSSWLTGGPISQVAPRFRSRGQPSNGGWTATALASRCRTARRGRGPRRTRRARRRRNAASLRMGLREGTVQLAVRLGIAPATAHRILTSAPLNRLSYVDRATGEPIRRYEHDHPGALVNVDVKKFGDPRRRRLALRRPRGRARRTGPPPRTSPASGTTPSSPSSGLPDLSS